MRCAWVDLAKPGYVDYHDHEWGVPVHEDQKLFEFLVLESAQAGLSWYTVLKKRPHYRKAFLDFNPEFVARFTEKDIDKLMLDPGLIRNRKKITAAVNNAQIFIKIQEQFGSFDNYIWDFVDGKPIVNKFKQSTDLPATTPISDRLSKDMKKRGFKFIGSTIIYAHMQATGMVNDHIIDCFRFHEVQKLF